MYEKIKHWGSQASENVHVLHVDPGPADRVPAAAALQAVPGHQARLSCGLLGAEELAVAGTEQ